MIDEQAMKKTMESTFGKLETVGKTANSKRTADQLKPFQFKKGQSGNPSGRPKDTLKAYIAKKLCNMSEEEKEQFLRGIPKETQWKMGEGNPPQSTDITSGGEPIEFNVKLTEDNGDNTSPQTIHPNEGQPPL